MEKLNELSRNNNITMKKMNFNKRIAKRKRKNDVDKVTE